MKKSLTALGIFALLLLGGPSASWALLTDLLLTSETKTGNVWYLNGGITHNDSTLDGSTLTINLLENNHTVTLNSVDGWSGEIPTNPDPSAANGEFITYTYENTTFSGRVPSSLFPEGYNGIIRVPTTYNPRVITASEKPVIAWSNDFNTEYPSYAPVDQYRIRVYDENGNMLVNHPIRSSETDLSSPDQTFDFNSSDFTFEEDVFYIIRIETREYANFYDENNQEIDDSDNGVAEFSSIINRNRVDMNYQFSNGQNIASTFKDVYLISENNANGWELYANPYFTSNPTNNPTCSINDTAAANVEIPFDSWGDYWGLVSTDPSDANGKTTGWSADGKTVTADIPDGSIIKVPFSTRLQLSGGTGNNPVISWENTSSDLDHFRVRVIKSGGNEFVVDERIYEFTPGETDTFDFSTISFAFETEKSYTIRIEARPDSISMENTQGVSSAYIINRSIAELSYTNTHGSASLPDYLDQTEISRLYVSIFGRASEGEGNAYWRSNQTDMVAAANTMLATEAAQIYFGDTLNDDLAFISFIYENTLGKTHEEDPDGINYWVSELAAGKSKGEVVAALVNAVMDPQYNGNPAQRRFINMVDVCDYAADNIPSADVNDLTDFVGFIENITDDSTTVDAAKALIDAFQ